MFPAASLLTVLLLALSITGSPVEVRNSPVTLPIVGRLNFFNGNVSLLQHDKARLAAFRDSSTRGRTIGTPVTNSDIALGYIAAVGVGSPPTTYNLVVDTGSSNTWVGANAKYVATKTSVSTHQPVEVDYGSGFFSGMTYTSIMRTEYIDTVTLGSGLTITKQSIGVASTSSGFTGVDGILGLGPVNLTESSLTNLPTTTIRLQGTIPQHVISVFFEPSSSQAETKGELTFGGTDATKYTGDIAYTPITTSGFASSYWGINESITYGSTTILSSTTGIVDTGTTFLLIATDALAKYQSATGATLDEKVTGLLTVSSAKYSALKNLDFHIGNEIYSLTPNAQIWPRSLNSYIGGSNSIIYLVVSDIGTYSGHGLFDFINGYAFLQRFYSVYDTANSRVGFAKTSFTDATTN
ncbi:aspartic proteinase [Suillus spraguei]|nr:aspartic proteinase [Suillus spraguei]